MNLLLSIFVTARFLVKKNFLSLLSRIGIDSFLTEALAFELLRFCCSYERQLLRQVMDDASIGLSDFKKKETRETEILRGGVSVTASKDIFCPDGRVFTLQEQTA